MTNQADPGLITTQSIDPETAFEDYNLERPLSAMVITHGWEKPPHAHRRAQLLLSVKGLITCEVASGLWLVPSQNALWIPPGKVHDMHCMGDVEIYLVFMDASLIGALPRQCCTLAISPLLRELIRAVSHLPPLYDETGPPAPLIQTMLNELAVAPVERLHLSMPDDNRLRRIIDGWAADPADRAGPGSWAQRIGMSERSLSRLVLSETGMSFIRWRQQFQIMQALERLARGVSVQHIAFDLGYESPSAFIAMFRKILGTSPSRYLTRSEKYLPHTGMPA
ncbi:AraC family transcriptional regulator [Novosphingobium rosa]|uniref:AraC family transcriptional regulator n=1 Tax=Novosphingobium rosa TaxID=76978 RepID=UPI000A004D63|nr:helix-turn-helix transcriptional regulator [Novosphingobium rosa]